MIRRNIRPRRYGQHGKILVLDDASDPELRIVGHKEEVPVLQLDLRRHRVGVFVKAGGKDQHAIAVGKVAFLGHKIEHRFAMGAFPGPGRHLTDELVAAKPEDRGDVADADADLAGEIVGDSPTEPLEGRELDATELLDHFLERNLAGICVERSNLRY